MESASKFVLLTYANSGFYRVAQAAIANFQEMMPNRTIVYYDLGLNPIQVAQVRSCVARFVLPRNNKLPDI